MLTIQAISAFKDNYIWFIQPEGTQKVIIVDPGDAEPVIQALKKQKLEPVALLITHGCHDHVDGISELEERYELPVYGPKNEFIPCLSQPLSESQNVFIDKDFPSIQVLDTPGHTRGHISFLIEDNLFCGDTLFGAGCGRLHSGPAEIMFDSLQKIARLAKNTNIYCAHEYTENNLFFASKVEPDNQDIQQRIKDTVHIRKQGLPSPPFSLEIELRTNPFLRCDQAEVIQSAEEYAGRKLPIPVDIFTHLRLWKDRF